MEKQLFTFFEEGPIKSHDVDYRGCMSTSFEDQFEKLKEKYGSLCRHLNQEEADEVANCLLSCKDNKLITTCQVWLVFYENIIKVFLTSNISEKLKSHIRTLEQIS